RPGLETRRRGWLRPPERPRGPGGGCPNRAEGWSWRPPCGAAGALRFDLGGAAIAGHARRELRVGADRAYEADRRGGRGTLRRPGGDGEAADLGDVGLGDRARVAAAAWLHHDAGREFADREGEDQVPADPQAELAAVAEGGAVDRKVGVGHVSSVQPG